MNLKTLSKGMSVLEVVIGASIILILVTAISGAWRSYIVISRISNEKNQAAIILEETADILQFARDNGWALNISNLSVNTDYYISSTTSGYTLTTTATPAQNNFSRKIVFSNVNRDVNDNITQSGGVNDTKTRKATITIASNQATPEVSIQTEILIHDVYNN